jgi:opacity protein-like surface antigen
MFKRLVLATIVIFMTAVTLGGATLGAADFYVGAGIGSETESGSFRADLERYTDSDDNPWKLLVGARFGDHLAFEVGHHDFGIQRCCTQIADLLFISTVEGFSAVALGRWPMSRFAPFAKAGVLSWTEDGEFITLLGPSARSADGTDLLFGAGVDVDLPANLTIRAEWESYDFDDASSDAAWASLLFRF